MPLNIYTKIANVRACFIFNKLDLSKQLPHLVSDLKEEVKLLFLQEEENGLEEYNRLRKQTKNKITMINMFDSFFFFQERILCDVKWCKIKRASNL